MKVSLWFSIVRYATGIIIGASACLAWKHQGGWIAIIITICALLIGISWVIDAIKAEKEDAE